MEVPFSWLRDWLIWNKDPRELIPIFESCGIEVDRCEKKNFLLRESLVARVVSHEEDLSSVQVSLGDKGSAIAHVPVHCLPPVNSYVPFFFLSQIEGGKLSLSSQCNGVVGSWCPGTRSSVFPFLPPGVSEEGKLLSHWYGEEYVFSLSLTPDLSFCQSIRGLALYLSCLKGIPLAHPEWMHSQVDLVDKGEVTTQVTVEALSAIRQYGWAEMEVLNTNWLPWDLYYRLKMSSLFSDTALSDVAQYVLFNIGHPLLCCDLDLISDPSLRLTWGVKSSFQTEGRSIDLHSEDVVLKSAEKSLFLSGIAENESCRVTEKSKNCLIEVAIYEPDQVGRTARRHHLLTPQARFLENIRSAHAFHLAWRQFDFLCETYEIASTIGRKWIQVGESLPFTRSIVFPVNLPKRLLGLSWNEKTTGKAMEELGHVVTSSSSEQIICSISTERCDLKGPEDLLDDLVKKVGIDSIPRPSSFKVPLPNLPHDPLYALVCSLRSRLCGWGFQEILSLDFSLSQKVNQVQEFLGENKSIRLQNPSSSEREFLRPSLLVSFLEHAERNLSHEEKSFRIFETGKVYFRLANGELKTEDRLGLFLAGDFLQENFWSSQEPSKSGDIFDLLGWIEAIAQTSNISFSRRPSSYSAFQEGQQVDLLIGEEIIGVAGKLSSQFGSVPFFFAEIRLLPFVECLNQVNDFVPILTYPASSRDVTVTLDSFIPYSQVKASMPSHDLLVQWGLLTVYSEGTHQHLTFRLCYRSNKKTLSHEEIEEAHQHIIQCLQEKLDAITLPSQEE